MVEPRYDKVDTQKQDENSSVISTQHRAIGVYNTREVENQSSSVWNRHTRRSKTKFRQIGGESA